MASEFHLAVTRRMAGIERAQAAKRALEEAEDAMKAAKRAAIFARSKADAQWTQAGDDAANRKIREYNQAAEAYNRALDAYKAAMR